MMYAIQDRSSLSNTYWKGNTQLILAHEYSTLTSAKAHCNENSPLLLCSKGLVASCRNVLQTGDDLALSGFCIVPTECTPPSLVLT